MVLDHEHGDVPVARLPGPEEQLADGGGLLHLAEGRRADLVEVHEAAEGIEHRDVDALALARALPGVERGGDREGRVQTRRLVREQVRDESRRLLRPDHLGDPRDRLDHHVVGGQLGRRALGPEAADCGVDEPRVLAPQHVPADAEPVEHARAEVLEHDVRLAREAAEGRGAALALEVEHDAPLVPVHLHEEAGHVRRAGAAHVAGGVADRRLDLDHVGAHVAEDLAAERAGDDRRQVEDADARERSRRLSTDLDVHGLLRIRSRLGTGIARRRPEAGARRARRRGA